jgi:hypothetical protein
MEKKIINNSKYIKKYQGKPIVLEMGPYIICITLRSFWKNGTAFCLQGDGCILLEIDQEKAQHTHLDFNHDTLPILVYRGDVTTMVSFFFDSANRIVRELTQEEHKTYKSALRSLMYKAKRPYIDVNPFSSRPNSGYTRVF